VKLGGRRPLKCKQNSMISLRYSMVRQCFWRTSWFSCLRSNSYSSEI
jgi:CRISPR/Cas system-associated endonuclease Cas1